MGFAETLKQKRGPFPGYVWFALFIAVMAWYFIRRRKQQQAAAAAAAAAAAQNGGANNGSGTGAPATNLGSNSLSNLVPSAYPMPFQQGDVFVNYPNTPANPPANNTTPSGGGSTNKTTPPPAPAGPKFPNQHHATTSQQNLMAYIKQWYPNATQQQLNEIGYATIMDPKNKQYNLGSGIIPKGAYIEIYSQAVK